MQNACNGDDDDCEHHNCLEIERESAVGSAERTTQTQGPHHPQNPIITISSSSSFFFIVIITKHLPAPPSLSLSTHQLLLITLLLLPPSQLPSKTPAQSSLLQTNALSLSLSLSLSCHLCVCVLFMEPPPARGRESAAPKLDSAGEEAELELGLGLSVGGGGGKRGPRAEPRGRILTARDFPSSVGTKRTADESVSQEGGGGSPTSGSQVVGWPPIRAYRMNSLVNLAKAPRAEDDLSLNEKGKSKDGSEDKTRTAGKTDVDGREQRHIGFVKVNMDGIPIGRKVDLNAHACYESLAQALEDMFLRPAKTVDLTGVEENRHVKKALKLLNGCSEFVLTYEDKEGDWMLIGDVPWGMFLTAVKRLRIMRTSEVNGIAPRFQQRSERQLRKPI